MASTLTTIWTALVLLLGLAESRHVWNRYRINPPAPRWLLALLPVAAAVMLTMVWIQIVHTPWDDWNGARVAPAVAWARGFPLYFLHGQSPGTDFIHGPVAAIVRLPAALATTPTPAVLIAAVINSALFFLPAIVFILCIRGPRLQKALSLLIFLGFTLQLDSLRYSAFYVHADAPAVGFALLACACMSLARRSMRMNRFLITAGACAVLATASKQNLAPIILILPLYCIVRFGWLAAILLAASELLIGALVAVSAILAFGYEPLRYTMFTVVSRHPWRLQQYGLHWSFLYGLSFLVVDIAAPAFAMGAALLLGSSARHSAGQFASRSLRSAWFLPLLVALLLIPFSIIGRIKLGGYSNALTPTSYFLTIALCAWIAGYRLSAIPQTHPDGFLRFVISISCMLVVGLSILALTPLDRTIQLWQETHSLQKNPQQQAYEFSLKHPHEAYFPWNPLSTLMSENRYYLFAYGVFDLQLAYDFRSVEQAKKDLPDQLKYVATHRDAQPFDLRGITPQYTRRVTLEALSNWNVYIREEDAPAR